MPWLLRTVLGLLLAVPYAAGAATFPAYNTYLHPPFVLADGSGLAATLVQALNRHMGDDRFVLQNVPRARLVAMLQQKQGRIDGVALFLSPVFLKATLASRVGWSEPLFIDHNVLVFRSEHVPAGLMPDSLRGLRFGAVRGHVYRYLDGMAQRRELRVEEVGDEIVNLRKLNAGRIDFTLLNSLHFQALAAQMPELQQLQALAQPGAGFTRRILLSPKLPPAVAQRAAAAILALEHDQEWQAALEKFGVSSGNRTKAAH